MQHDDPRIKMLIANMATGQRAIYGYILSLVPSRNDADDILQQTYLAIWQKADEFDGRGKFLTWACRIAYFEVLRFSKSRQRDRHSFFDQTIIDEIAAESERQLDSHDEQLAAMHGCIETLPASSREMLAGWYAAENADRYATAVPGQSESALRVRIHRIRKALLDCIEGKLAVEKSL